MYSNASATSSVFNAFSGLDLNDVGTKAFLSFKVTPGLKLWNILVINIIYN